MFTSARQKISSREHDKKCRRKYTNIKTFRFKNRMEEEGNECVMGGYGIELEFSSRAAFLFPKYFLILCTLLHVLFCKTAFVLNHSKKKSNKQKHIELLRKKIVLSFVSPLTLSYLCQAIQSKCLRHSLSWCKYEENKYNIYLPLNKIPIEFLFNSNVLQKLICVTVEDSK